MENKRRLYVSQKEREKETIDELYSKWKFVAAMRSEMEQSKTG